MTGMDTITAAYSLLDAGRAPDALHLLSQGAQADDLEALHELAQWCVAGNIIPRNLKLARKLFARAGEIGHAESALLHAYFTASGTGGQPDWEQAHKLLRKLASVFPIAKTQVALIDAMALEPDGNPSDSFALEQCSTTPNIAIHRQFLTPAECDYIVAAGTPNLAPSVVFDPQTGQLIPNPVRKSQGVMFGVHSEDLVINAVNRRIAKLSGTAFDQGEPLQLLQYKIGDEYRPHLDALTGEPNQRVMTVIVYLSDNYSGGETQFIRTGFSFSGGKGDAIIFSNTLPDGGPIRFHCIAAVS